MSNQDNSHSHSNSNNSIYDEGQHDDATGICNETIARRETKVIQILRVAVISVLLLAGAVTCAGIYFYASAAEQEEFESIFEENARQVIKSFSNLVERHLEAASWMSSILTSHALQTNQSFPFITLPHFEQQGSHFRALSGSHVLHYAPLVTNDNRDEYERYALENRFHINTAFEQDLRHRLQQDEELGRDRRLQEGSLNMTVLGDETGYHPKIWRTGALLPPGDEPIGHGPFMPLWQRR